MLITLVLSMLGSTLMILHVRLKSDDVKNHLLQEGEAFFAYVSHEIEGATQLSSSNTKQLILKLSDGTSIWYRVDNGRIVRSVKDPGSSLYEGFNMLKVLIS